MYYVFGKFINCCVYLFGYCEGITIWHSVVDIVTVYSLLSFFGGTKLSLLLTWIVTMV